MKKTSRRNFIRTTGTAAAALPLFGFYPDPKINESLFRKNIEGRRNIIFILSDDHRYDFVGFLNKPKFLETPNMDKMAGEGAYVKNAFVIDQKNKRFCHSINKSKLLSEIQNDNNALVTHRLD